MAMVYTNGKMVIDTKVNGKIVLNMVKALRFLPVVTRTLESTSMVNPVVLDSTNGCTEPIILEILNKE